jgi:putative Holliday junction resolvase
MRYMGIDFGSKRVGVAVSDAGGVLAFPKGVYENSPLLIERLMQLIRDEGVDVIVLGESNDYKGKPNPIMKDILVFRESIENESGLRVVLEPEVLSSREAAHIQGDNHLNDASAAAIVLQGYLDRANSSRDVDDEV